MAKNKQSSKKSVENTVKEFYNASRVSESVRNTELDFTRLRRNTANNPDINKYKETIYQTYNIRQFNSKQEFFDEHRGYVNEDDLARLWKDYEHRDKLIQSGQYEEMRLRGYQSAYVEKLKKTGYPKEVISNIEKLDYKDFSRIALLPNADKSSLKKSVLPDIGSFYYPTVGVAHPIADILERNVNDIVELFRNEGFEWEEEDSNKSYWVLRKLKYKFIDKDKRDMVIDDQDVDTYIDSIVSLIDEEDLEALVNSPKYSNRFNEFYVKGVGSTNTKSKSRGIMTRFIGSVKKALGYYD